MEFCLNSLAKWPPCGKYPGKVAVRILSSGQGRGNGQGRGKASSGFSGEASLSKGRSWGGGDMI